jgi:CRISPR/Cas system-associated exonuclease Cas4 (RecB family)
VDQFYCEQKLNLSLEHPEVNISSIKLDDGIESHKILEDEVEPLSPEEIQNLIEKKEEFMLSEKSFIADFKGITIGGKPDIIMSKGKNADLLIEFKFSPKQRPFNTHHSQCHVYGYLLNKNGFETKNLQYSLVFFSEPLNLGDERNFLEFLDSDGMLSIISKELNKAKTKKPQKGKKYIGPIKMDFCKSYIYPFRMDEAIRILDWASEYWHKKRDPMPTQNKNKCRICGFNAIDFCNNALVDPLDTMIVEKEKINGQIEYNVIIPK